MANTRPHLLTLPCEVRNLIYHHLFQHARVWACGHALTEIGSAHVSKPWSPADAMHTNSRGKTIHVRTHDLPTAVTESCHLLRHESLPVLWQCTKLYVCCDFFQGYYSALLPASLRASCREVAFFVPVNESAHEPCFTQNLQYIFPRLSHLEVLTPIHFEVWNETLPFPGPDSLIRFDCRVNSSWDIDDPARRTTLHQTVSFILHKVLKAHKCLPNQQPPHQQHASASPLTDDSKHNRRSINSQLKAACRAHYPGKRGFDHESNTLVNHPPKPSVALYTVFDFHAQDFIEYRAVEDAMVDWYWLHPRTGNFEEPPRRCFFRR